MKEKQSFPHQELSLKEESDLKKIKLMAEFGAVFPSDENEVDLPPEIELRFLDFIEAVEKATSSCEKVSLYNFIGKPAYQPENLLPEPEVEEELVRLKKCMSLKNIILQVPSWISKREEYRFITEELFPFQIRDIPITGITHTFNLEEIDLTRNRIIDAVKRLVEGMLNRDFDVLESLFPGKAAEISGKLDKEIFHFEPGEFENLTIKNIEFLNEKLIKISGEIEMTAGWNQSGEIILREKENEWELKSFHFSL